MNNKSRSATLHEAFETWLEMEYAGVRLTDHEANLLKYAFIAGASLPVPTVQSAERCSKCGEPFPHTLSQCIASSTTEFSPDAVVISEGMDHRAMIERHTSCPVGTKLYKSLASATAGDAKDAARYRAIRREVIEYNTRAIGYDNGKPLVGNLCDWADATDPAVMDADIDKRLELFNAADSGAKRG